MLTNNKLMSFLKLGSKYTILYLSSQKCYHKIPFLNLYEKVTGEQISERSLPALKKKHPHIDVLTEDRLQCTLQILEKFKITPHEACQNPHLFSMHPITMDNYGEILRECGFINVLPIHILRYHTLVRNKTIEHLKKKGLIATDFALEETLLNCFKEWPAGIKTLEKFQDSKTSILTVRMSVLQKYLNWKLSATPEEFQKYCRCYITLKHKPMTDILQALDIAENNIKFDLDTIRRNGFIVAMDPLKTKMIIDNVKTLAGLDIREAIKIEPAILKNNDVSILRVRDILQEWGISEEAQRNCLKIYCMNPQTVSERLEELKKLKEFNFLSTNLRVLSLVVHQKKVISRLSKIQDAKKQCYTFNNLVGSSKVFNTYINNFGNKICAKDIAMLITFNTRDQNSTARDDDRTKAVLKQLKKHKYWLHAALSVVDENIHYLKTRFSNQIVLNHCQLLLYPISEIKYYLDCFLKLRNGDRDIIQEGDFQPVAYYNNINYQQLSDDQILSLVLYEIEKKYHFSGDGIWIKQEGNKMDARVAS